MKKILLFVTLLIITLSVRAGDDIMITRDGEIREVKIDRITNENVIFVDLKRKKKGKQTLPTTFVYLIKTEKRGNIFFDEEGNQITRKAEKVGNKDEVVYLISCEEVVAYDLMVSKNEIKYKEADKKKAPFVTKKKEDVFMIRHSDGSKDLFSGVKQAPGTLATTPIGPSAYSTNNATSVTATTTPPTLSAAADRANTVTPSTTDTPQGSVAPIISQQGSNVAPVLTSEEGATYSPAINLDAQTIINKVYEANPYALHRRGAVAEYKAVMGEKEVLFLGKAGSYLHITVVDETVNNGVVRVLTSYSLLDKNHEPIRGLSAKWKDTYYQTEIDTAGTYHLTNDILSDLFVVSSRQGYAALIPGTVKNNFIKTSREITNCSYLLMGGLGGTTKLRVDYSKMRYLGEERVTTPAGTFDCIKLSGYVSSQNGKNSGNAIFTWWLARNVGFVRIDNQSDSSTITYYLNKLTGI